MSGNNSSAKLIPQAWVGRIFVSLCKVSSDNMNRSTFQRNHCSMRTVEWTVTGLDLRKADTDNLENHDRALDGLVYTSRRGDGVALFWAQVTHSSFDQWSGMWSYLSVASSGAIDHSLRLLVFEKSASLRIRALDFLSLNRGGWPLHSTIDLITWIELMIYFNSLHYIPHLRAGPLPWLRYPW